MSYVFLCRYCLFFFFFFFQAEDGIRDGRVTGVQTCALPIYAAEDVLAEVRSGTRVADNHIVSAVLAIIDRIGELVQALETGEAISSADEIGRASCRERV